MAREKLSLPIIRGVDILTGDYAIEVKPKLTRSALLQALGQSTIYKMNCPDHTHVIAGLTPKNTSESYATAERVRASGAKVWYVDQMDEFINHWNGATTPQRSNPFQGVEIFGDDDEVLGIPIFWWIIGAVCLAGLFSFGGAQKPKFSTTPVKDSPNGISLRIFPAKAR